MQEIARAFILFGVAAISEIGGAYLIWQWQRADKPFFWALLGLAGLFFYSLIQTIQSFGFGRSFAAYGGIFIFTALMWGWLVDGHRPDQWDIAGGAICLVGVLVILAAPRP